MAQRRPTEKRASAAKPKSVFLNLPYDHSFQNVFLSFIAGTSALGLIPPATLEIPGSTRRLDRILSLIYENLRSNLRLILRDTGASSPFEASVFKRLSVYASALADEVVTS